MKSALFADPHGTGATSKEDLFQDEMPEEEEGVYAEELQWLEKELGGILPYVGILCSTYQGVASNNTKI